MPERRTRAEIQEQRDRLDGFTVHYPWTEALAELVHHLSQGESVTIYRKVGRRHVRTTVEVEV